MKVSTLWRWLTLLFLCAFSTYVTWPPKEKIRLGLDLQGGTSFTVVIDQERLAENIRNTEGGANLSDADVAARIKEIMTDADQRTLEVLRNRIDALGTQEPVIAAGQNHQILIQIPGADAVQAQAAEDSIKSAAFLTFRLVHRESAAEADKLLSGNTPIEGYTRSTTTKGQRCLVRDDTYAQLQKDPAYAGRLGRTGTPGTSYELMFEKAKEKSIEGKPAFLPFFIQRAVLLTGEKISKADVQADQFGKVGVSMTFKTPEEFAKITADYKPYGNRNKNSPTGRQLAIILDDLVYSAPVINSEIPNGKAEITGNFSWTEAVVLRNVLNAGSLPAPIKILAKSSVSPTLGVDAIQKGVRAGVIGVGLVLIFMVIYYTYCGVVADIALLLNAFLWPAGMIIASSLLSVFIKDAGMSTNLIQLPVLTLPGIAGLVLSVGMAVDANVLIFERMREEFKTGKTARAAVAAGYNRAYLAILDSNLTTLIVGAILFVFGSGPIRGFAVTLCGGIIISMFTALVVTRLIFDRFTPESRVKPYKMLQLIPGTVNFDFFKYAKPCMIASAAIIALTLAVFGYKAVKNPNAVFAVDFSGGITMTFDGAKGDIPADDNAAIQKLVTDGAGATDAIVQQQRVDLEGKAEYSLSIKTSTMTVKNADGKEVDTALVVTRLLQEKYPDLGIQLQSQEAIGSQVGASLKKDAALALLLSLVGIIIYIKVRFEFGFGFGGVVGLAHDALITLGLFTILGKQVSLTTVAGLLTVVGYSINDTIVIFDRIREDMRKDVKTPFQELVNRAMNQTLSRTILTTASTLLTVAALYFLGGEALKDFSFILLIGMLVGTYSTLFIATPLMVYWYRGERPKAVVDTGAPKTSVY